MSEIVLDTCALLAYAEGLPMRRPAVDAILAAQASESARVPGVTVMEVAQKFAKGRLVLGDGISPRVWIADILRHPGFRELPTTVEAALAAYELPEPFHNDPADRLIVAMARLLDAPVVTVDRQILAYGRLGHVQTIDY